MDCDSKPLPMTDGSDRLTKLRALAETVARSAHDDVSGDTIDRVVEFVQEVEGHLNREEVTKGAEKLLAFWEAYVRTELERSGESANTIAEDTIERFEQAFDRDVIGVDMYQALETLAIVENMPDADTDEDRFYRWASRVTSLTEKYASHLEGHR